MEQPRDGVKLASPTSTLAFRGYSYVANDSVSFQVQNQANPQQWRTLVTVVSDSVGVLDPGGHRWFSFAASANLPFSSGADRNYWEEAPKVGTQRRIRADTRATSTSLGNFYSFAQDADNCAVQQGNGILAAQNCHSSNFPEAQLFADCGKKSQVCCHSRAENSFELSCDNGQRCNKLNNTCSVPSGGFGQVCNGNGSCSGTGVCVRSTCWTQLENAPVYMIAVNIRTGGDGTDSKIGIRLNNDVVFLDKPGDDFGMNKIQTFAITPSDVRTIADIRRFEIINHGNDALEFTNLDLIVNRQTIFTSTGARTIDANGATDRVTFSENTLRNHPNWQPGQACEPPRRIFGTEVRDKIEGIVGDKLNEQDETSWGSGGFVRLASPGDHTYHIDMRFRGSFLEATADVTTRTPLGISCTHTCTEGGGFFDPSTGEMMFEQTICSSDGDVSLGATEILIIDGNFAFGAFDSLFNGVATGIVQTIARSTGGLELSLGLGDDLPICLPTFIENDESLNINWNINGLILNPPMNQTIDVGAIPNALCIAGRPF